MRVFGVSIILGVLVFVSCSKEEDYSIEGNWTLRNINCDNFSYLKEYSLSFTEGDSAWGILVLNNSDSTLFTYSYVQEQYLKIDSSNSDFWKGTIPILNQHKSKLTLEFPNDSCVNSEWVFKK